MYKIVYFNPVLFLTPNNVIISHMPIGHLQDPVTWYGINYTGTQMTQWDFQNKGKSGWTGKSSFVLKVPLRHLRPSVIYSVPCDWILQMAYY